MVWCGSSAGVAISHIYHEAKSVGAWLKGGWHVALAYVLGFLVMYLTLGWNPHKPHRDEHKTPASSEAPAAH